eukprot:symbB.v1.2.007019.t1/scaffold427.1/size208084/1
MDRCRVEMDWQRSLSGVLWHKLLQRQQTWKLGSNFTFALILMVPPGRNYLVIRRSKSTLHPSARAKQGSCLIGEFETLEGHVCTWRRVADWVQTVFGCHWPSSDQFVAYLVARAAQPCGKTVPTQCYKTLLFMEAAGEVAHEARISSHPAVLNTLEELKVSLSAEKLGPPKQALQLFVSQVCSMERLVLAEQMPRYVRAFAWFKLFKLWGCLRYADTEGMPASSVVLEARGLRARLDRTKTSGAGKRLEVLRAFVVIKQMGRWQPSASEAYVRSVRANVEKAQAHIAKQIRQSMHGGDFLDEASIMVKVSELLLSLGCKEERVDEQIDALRSFAVLGPASPSWAQAAQMVQALLQQMLREAMWRTLSLQVCSMELLDAQVPGPVVEEIVQLYGSKTVFKFSFLSADSLEKFAKTLLVKTKLVDNAGSDAADIHPALGALRAVHASLHSPACQPVEKVTEIQPTLLSTSMHAGRMHGGDREELRKQFAADYPGAGLNERVLPSLQYLHTTKQQCAQKAWEWLPWRKVLSEEQAMKLKEKRSASKLEMVDLLAHASGIWEESMEGFAFCGHGHMNLWWAYVDAFISAYTRSPPDGFRQPAIQEAEEADRRVLQEIFHLLYKGWTMDKALQCVIKEREAFRTQLVCVPRVSRKPVVDKADMSLPKCDSVPGAALAAESCPSVPVCHAVQPGIHVAITDGGGNGSTAAWLVPQAHHDTLQPLRQKFLRLVADWGVLSRLETISASGIWDSVPEDEDADVGHLQAHTQPWKSAQDDPKLARSLLMQDVEAGFAYILPGGFAAAKQRWGGNLAAGKLGIVQAVGKKPRLIGDGSISGANGRCTIQERPRLPGLHGVQRFLSMCARESEWVALSFDVACAHKRVRVHDSEQGFGCFALEDELFVYRCCYFGAKYSAYWWSRVGGWITRMLHRFVWVSHALFLYVDDGMLVPKSVAPLLASACLAFLSALGVPLSWRKVQLRSEIVWIGWRFCFKTATAALPSDKVAKILDLLKPLCVAKAKVQRKHVEQVVGILIWYTTGASWLRPWLSTFYKLLYKPHAIPKKLSVQQFEQLRVVLGHDLSVRKPLPALDVDENWKLRSVCGSVVSSLHSQVLQAPRVHQGSVSVVFFSQNHPSTRTCEESVYAAKLFVKAVSTQAPFPLYWQMGGALIGAADAYATEADAGLGGWWLPTGCTLAPQNTLWFQISLQHSDLPAWFCSPQSKHCCAGSAGAAGFTHSAGARNSSATGAEHSCSGVRNIWADMLSRGKALEGFNMANRRCIDLATVVTKGINVAALQTVYVRCSSGCSETARAYLALRSNTPTNLFVTVCDSTVNDGVMDSFGNENTGSVPLVCPH